MNGNPITIIVVLVLVIFGGWFFLSENMTDVPAPVITNQMPIIGSTTPETIVENVAPDVTVIYNDDGFLPKSVTIPSGTTVTFINQGMVDMWVASAMHPTHTVYSGTSLSQHCPNTTNTTFDACIGVTPGNSFSFTFNKEGNWKYHDHINASKSGAVTVTASP